MSVPQMRAVVARTIFDGRTVRHDEAVLIDGPRIAWVGPRAQVPPDVPVFALPGDAWLAPGFIDIQVNGGGDVLFNAEPTPAAISRIFDAHRRYGTTALLPTLISDTSEKMRAAIGAVAHPSCGHNVLGIHFEGPFLSSHKMGIHDAKQLRVPAAGDLYLLTSLASKLTLVTLAPECVRPGFIAALVARGTRVALGHSMATHAQTRAALSEGLSGFTHLFNAMRQLDSREPGPIAAALECTDAFFGMIVDGVHVAPAMLRLALRGAATPMLVTDAMPPVGGVKSTFSLAGTTIEVQGDSCRSTSGVLAGTTLNMEMALRNCVQMLGVPLATALGFASREPARFLGVDDRMGRLSAGFQADMVAVCPDAVRVLGTWVAGEWKESWPNNP